MLLVILPGMSSGPRNGREVSGGPPSNSLQRTALHAAAERER